MHAHLRDKIRKRMLEASEAICEARDALVPVDEETRDLDRALFVVCMALRDADYSLSIHPYDFAGPRGPRTPEKS